MKNFSDFRNCISRLASRRGLPFVCGFALLLLLLPARLHGQAVSRINGDVTDQAGAEVPDAKVTVTNVDTNVSKTSVTTSVGTYLVIDLIPGTYVVRVEKAGFKTFISKNVVVVGAGPVGLCAASPIQGNVQGGRPRLLVISPRTGVMNALDPAPPPRRAPPPPRHAEPRPEPRRVRPDPAPLPRLRRRVP